MAGSYQNEFHAETNILSTFLSRAPITPLSIGQIYMLIDHPNGGIICAARIQRFDSFKTYAPAVELTAIALNMQYENGLVTHWDASRHFR